MNLKESILNKLDYDSIAREVFNILKDEIMDEVVNNIDEGEIANAIADAYSYQLIEIAKDRVLESIMDEIKSSRDLVKSSSRGDVLVWKE